MNTISNQQYFPGNRNGNYKMAIIFAAVSAYLEEEKIAGVMAAVQSYLEQESIPKPSSISNWKSAYRRMKVPFTIRWGYPSLNRF